MNRSRHLLVLAVAGLMLLVSFAGGATAAKMITGKQIQDGTVTSRDIKNGTVNTRDIKNRSVTTRDVKDRTLKLRDFRKGTKARLRGEDGADGLPGIPGADGLDGVSGFEVVTQTTSVPPSLTETVSVLASCPDGKTALAASGGFGTLLDTLSQVTRVDDDTFSATGLNADLLGPARTLTLDVVCVTLAESS